MKITKAQVRTFRSIVDSGEVEINDRLTILIGKNEQGKSNFLRALKSFNVNYKYFQSDLTNHLSPSLQRKLPAEIPILTLWFTWEPSEGENLGKTIKNIDSVKYLKVTKYYDNHYNFTAVGKDDTETEIVFTAPNITKQVDSVKNKATTFKQKLVSHAQRLPEFVKNKDKTDKLVTNFLESRFDNGEQIENLTKTFLTGLRSLPGQDKAVQDDIALLTKESEPLMQEIKQILSDEDSNRTKYLMKQLPVFILHSSLMDNIPNEVDLEQFLKEPEKTSPGMLNLCKAAGLSIQTIGDLRTAVAATREPHEDYCKSLISGGINAFWSQESYDINFRIEQNKLSVSISDNTYSPRIPPSERSEGFQWLLSFYCTLQSEWDLSETVVILLDNPALELHVDGQRDIKKLLEEGNIAQGSQIMYVTHSPALVDPMKIDQIRIAKLLTDNRGTKILNRVIKEGADFDLLEPLRTAIGSCVGYSLLANKYNILVEGNADKSLLEGILYRFFPSIKNEFFINGSLSESKDCQIAAIYKGLGLHFISVLDSDSGGRKLANLLGNIGIEKNSIVKIEDIFVDKQQRGDFALADIISDDFYFKAVKEAYIKETEEMKNKPEKNSSKIENVYEKEFKERYSIGFSKTRVARVLRKMLIEDRRIDRISEANCKKIVAVIKEKLSIATL